ncbi:MAG: hypothetical protein R2795_13505 [Saprospiraceae bacterium]
MKATIFFIVLHLLSGSLLAQFADDFSSPALATHWQGDVDKFTITDGRLQLNDSSPASSNTSTLYALAPVSMTEATSWRLQLQNDFAPSTSNFTTIYLSTNVPPLPGTSFNGYFLKIGGISGAEDAVQLYRQDGASSELLLSGAAGSVANEPVLLGVQITRTTAGEWQLETDYAGGEDYDLEVSTTDATYPTGLYFGFGCRYSSSRNMAFFFDNVVVDPIVVDTDAPAALSVSPLSPQSIVITCNEPLGDASLDPANFLVDNGIGVAQNVTFDGVDRSRLVVNFSTVFTNFSSYSLLVSGLSDIAGNVSLTQELPFQFLLPELPVPGDLWITEIFPDPTPVVGLPDAEYVEILNTSNKPLQLGGVTISTGSTPRALPDIVLLPQTYLTLCPTDAEADLGVNGLAVGVPSFPALTNGGDDLLLAAADGTVLVSLVYDASWFRDDLRAAGGYSLELIGLDAPNDCPGNWGASLAQAGGTPGQQNAIWGQSTETAPPSLLRAFANDATTITLTFDDVLDSSLEWIDFVQLSPAVTIGDALLHADRQSVTLFLSTPLAENVVYEVRVLPGIRDCLGNNSSEASTAFVGLAVSPQPGDLIINELLFNPFTGGVDFVELYNPGPRLVSLSGLRLRNNAITSGTVGTVVEQDFVVLPDSWVVLTPDPANILSNYTVPHPANLLENELPSLPDDEGNLTILNAAFEVLDSLNYTDDWHNALLSDKNGVSLERLRPDQASQNEGNWHSAASSVGYATPTGQNSQFRDGQPETGADFLRFQRATFSPDGDGFEDVLEVFYETPNAGYVGQFYIFDTQGRLIYTPNRLALLPGTGTFLWDGVTNESKRAPIGIYILFAEIFTPEGDVIREKHPFVVAGKLD